MRGRRSGARPTHPRTLALGAALAVTVGILAVFFADTRPPRRPPPPRGRNLIVVLVDTLRADHLGIYGYTKRDTSPHLDAFARRGRWFSEVWSTAPWTPPSVWSIFTSTLPSVHGLNLQGDHMARLSFRPSADLHPLAEVLLNQGLRTVAFTAGGGVGANYGFGRGFEAYHAPSEVGPEDVVETTGRALAWIETHREERFFMFLHTYEVHLPNTHDVYPPEGDARERAERAYDGDLHFADAALGAFFDRLDGMGLLDTSVVMVVADHGETLHERVLGGKGVEHGHHLHDELLRVPFIVVAPGLVPAAGAIDGAVTNLDVKPTALALLGVDGAGLPMQGVDRSRSLVASAPVVPTAPIFAEAPIQGPLWWTIRTPTAKLIHSPPVAGEQFWAQTGEPAEALYDLATDPGETTNVLPSRPSEAQALRAAGEAQRATNRALRQRLGPPEMTGAPPEAEAQLRALGYLDAAAPGGTHSAPSPTP